MPRENIHSTTLIVLRLLAAALPRNQKVACYNEANLPHGALLCHEVCRKSIDFFHHCANPASSRFRTPYIKRKVRNDKRSQHIDGRFVGISGVMFVCSSVCPVQPFRCSVLYPQNAPTKPTPGRCLLLRKTHPDQRLAWQSYSVAYRTFKPDPGKT